MRCPLCCWGSCSTTPNSRYAVQCFSDDDMSKVNMRIRKVPVIDTADKALHRVVPTFHEPDEVNEVQGETVEIPSQESAS